MVKIKQKAKTKGIPWNQLNTVLLVLFLAITVFQGYQISTLKNKGVTGKATAGTNSNGASLQEIVKEITPTGTPDYGKKTGVSYDNIEQSLRILASYDQAITLSDEEKQRYISIATTPGTACEYCCGIGNAGFGTSAGQIACGCSHNVAFSGLTKLLITTTGYTNKQIVQEIQKWKILFFPKDSVAAELQKRGVNPESVGLPGMVGGC